MNYYKMDTYSKHYYMFGPFYYFSLFHHLYFLGSICAIVLKEYISFKLFSKSLCHCAENLCKQLVKKNVLCVKIFQAIALNNDWIDEEFNSHLKIYTDQAPYDNFDINYKTLKKLNHRYNLQCIHMSIPYRSGMISLVYKMIDSNGETKIVKIKRRNIEAKLEQSIQELQFIIRLLSWVPYFNALDISTSLDKNIGSLKQQLDFQEEVKNMREAYQNCSRLSYLRIPQVYDEITEQFDNVIVMEYLEGVSIQEVAQEDYDIYAKLIIKYGIVSLLLHGVTHGDLHGGNILFIKTIDNNTSREKYQLGILDFGIVLRLHENFKKTLLEIFIHLFTKPSIELARDILFASIEPVEVFRNLPEEHMAKILTFTANIIHDTIHVAKQANQVKIYEFLTEFYNYLSENNLKKLGLKVNENVIKIQMALGMCNGLNMTLCKRDIIRFADVVLKEMFHLDLLM
jgi:predicted unusual protein kinase regulating ubiquinone biosynthesis (AarF/ABC1/UbiB family)